LTLLGTVLAAAWLATAGPTGAGDRLPEDPVEGAKATAQWHEHMVREERDRKLHYDRARIREHRAVLRLLAQARGRYDRARTPAAVAAARARLPQTVAEARRQIAVIDHWGVNSNLLADYDAILTALGDAYPTARLAALQGDAQPLTRLRAELADRDRKIAAWLAEAAASKDE
jgi:hypothetical protein